jgi:hypothetical protein
MNEIKKFKIRVFVSDVCEDFVAPSVFAMPVDVFYEDLLGTLTICAGR